MIEKNTQPALKYKPGDVVTLKVARLNEKIEKLNEVLSYENFKDMTLADIYNVEDASFIKETKKIGF